MPKRKTVKAKAKTKTKTKIKKETRKVPTDLFGKQIDVLESEFGDKVLESLSSIQARPIIRSSSGSLALDYIMSPRLGGVRSGLMMQLWGEPSTGKTTIALAYAANITAAKRKVIFLDAEKTFDPALAQAAGVDADYFHVLKKSAEKSINILYRILQTGQVGAVIIDSISALRPHPTEKADKDIDITREQIAYHASFIAKWMPRIADICSDNDVLLIVINQARNKLGNYMGGTKAGSGGYTLEHYLAMSMKFQGRAQQSSYRIIDAQGKIVGQTVKCTCDKSKIDVPFKEVEIPLFFGLGVNPYMELAYLSVMSGAITKNGGFHYLAGSDAGYIARSGDEFTNLLYSDVELFKSVRAKTIELLGLVYPEGDPFVNPFLNEDLTPKTVKYIEEPEKESVDE